MVKNQRDLMATERQIAANRRNATKSIGPRSRAGKKRAGHNAYRHGLSLRSTIAFAKEIEILARKIAGESEGEVRLEYARDAPQATIDLARVRRVKIALIERALGALDRPRIFNSVQEIGRSSSSIERGERPTSPERVEPSATMPSQESDRTAEAMRRALPELIKLDRYESRAAARRDRAILEVTRSRLEWSKQS
jgi:hypothetical protein